MSSWEGMIKTISGLLIFTFIFELRSILVLVNIDASQAEGTEFEPKFLFLLPFLYPYFLSLGVEHIAVATMQHVIHMLPNRNMLYTHQVSMLTCTSFPDMALAWKKATGSYEAL